MTAAIGYDRPMFTIRVEQAVSVEAIAYAMARAATGAGASDVRPGRGDVVRLLEDEARRGTLRPPPWSCGASPASDPAILWSYDVLLHRARHLFPEADA